MAWLAIPCLVHPCCLGEATSLPVASLMHHPFCCCPVCRSLVCGTLASSTTACLYFLPSHGPTSLDLALMAALSRHVPLLPVVSRADTLLPEQAEEVHQLVAGLLAEPGLQVPGLSPDSIKLAK